MGVPGFFSWLMRNYKERKFIVQNLPQKAKILYIDSNCLFHPQCFKILDSFSSLNNLDKLENNMFRRVLNYIDYLVGHANPEIVYISVDGVAPLAKISQQRKRRFKSIEDNLAKEAIKTKHNIEFNNTWSNTKITPGTVFMEKLHNKIVTHLKEKSKKNNNVKYIYSSYHTVGEGEHKILDDIRKRTIESNNKNKEDIYVIYGLDADLFFLSMASQKENIYLLRESSHLDGKTQKYELFDPIDDVAEDLKYVSIDLTKACYNNQIINILKKKVDSLNKDNESKPIKIDFENKNFINDFIFLCYLLGNDFLPHIPSIDIKKNGLDFLLDCYSEVYIKTQLNLVSLKSNHKIKINYIVLTEILRICSLKESYYFSKILPEHVEMHNRKKCLYDDDYNREIWELDNIKNFKVEDNVKLGVGKPEEWKYRYYSNYFARLKEYELEDSKSIKDEKYKTLVHDLCKNYFEGLEWVSKYYFEGCPSWLWQYRYTHSPFVSDLYFYLKNNFVEVKFKKDSPLEPCVQLLSVLPPACHKELPKKFQKLVTDNSSPIKDMFPESQDIEIDYLYKDQLWECVPMIPYLNVDRIKNECSKHKLSKDEEVLNKIYDDIVF
jgi:5'-3' exoribonuclease 2